MTGTKAGNGLGLAWDPSGRANFELGYKLGSKDFRLNVGLNIELIYFSDQAWYIIGST